MADRAEIIREHYGAYDEDSRLSTRWGSLEEATTWKYINMAVGTLGEDKEDGEPLAIAEIGAGTGRYSVGLARRGHSVTAVDLVQSNLEGLLDNARQGDVLVKTVLADATNLSYIEDESQDIVLCLGPLYHLYNDADIDRAIAEASRICHPGGFVMFSYLTQDSIMASYFLRHNCLEEGIRDGRIEEGFKPRVHEDEVFVGAYISEFLDMMRQRHGELEFVANAATDGIAPLLREHIDELTDDGFEVWRDYHLATCERVELQGFSSHMLWVGRKRG